MELAAHDADRFVIGAPNFLTQDEESSGIIDVTNMFKGVAGYDIAANRYYLLTSARRTFPIPGRTDRRWPAVD